jgi:hypothetical protein
MKKSLVFAAMLVPALALAQPKSAEDWYKQGETHYNLGEFDKAAEAFKQGFALEPNDSKKPAYLYNVAQSYRQGGRCKDAAFFYKRYLSLKDQDTVKPLKPEKRAEIEQKIVESEECAKTIENVARKPPDNTISPGSDGSTRPKTGPTTTKTGPTTTKTGPTTTGPTTTGPTTPGPTTTGGDTTIPVTGTGTTTTGPTTTGPTVGQGGEEQVDEVEEEEEVDGGDVSAGVLVKPRVINARFVGGVSKISMGDLPTGVKPAFALTGGFPVVTQGQLTVDAGASLGFTPVPYTNGMTGGEESASMTTLLANAAATYAVAPKIGLRGDLGLGVLMFGGLKMGNPFTENGAAASGSLGMFALRVAASADYALTPNIVATVTPLSVSYSPAKEGLREDVSSILRLEFMLGVGYRM